jgi:hypothetical protein
VCYIPGYNTNKIIDDTLPVIPSLISLMCPVSPDSQLIPPARYRQLFYLYYIQGYNTQDLKAILNKGMKQIEKDLEGLNRILRNQVEDKFLEEFIKD